MEFKAEIEAIGKNIANERKRQNLTQHRLADMATMNEGYLCEVEKGIANPTIGKLLSLAEALGVPVSSLLSGIGRAGPPQARPAHAFVQKPSPRPLPQTGRRIR